MAEPPRISVIVATIEHWPTIQPCLERLLPQIERARGELIVADGTPEGTGAPAVALRGHASLTTIAVPGAGVLALRAVAAMASAAPLVAFTEDHCVVSERWVEQIVAAHAAHPDADMVSGPVTNGSSDGVVDWANFIMTFAEFMPPTPPRPLKRTPPMSNASFRRSVLLAGPLPEGWLEVVMALAAHFHNGRACAGLALPHLAPRDWRLRLATVPVLPAILFVSVLRSLRGRQVPVRAQLSLPALWLLCMSHAAGELTGLLRGEGLSARRLN